MYGKGWNSRDIPSYCPKDGDFFQEIHSPTYSPTEAESKDLLEPKRMKQVENLQSYQNETRAWRDKKVKHKHIKAGDLVLLWSPRTEAYGKLEPKWSGPFVVTEKTDHDPFAWPTMKAGCWSTPGTPTTFVIFTFSWFCKSWGSVTYKQAIVKVFTFLKVRPILFSSQGKPARVWNF
jgi:hypothetical protein